MKKIFHTNYSYSDRKSKATYVFDKYSSLLSVGSTLDVGADSMFLKPLIESSGGHYFGIGFGDGIDCQLDLENFPYPFDSSSFDTVICLDVLEHLEYIHDAFDELCRMSSNHVIISLPNPFAGAFGVLRGNNYKDDESIKFYGLPLERPSDRHRWFFNEFEAVEFVMHKAEENNFEVVQCGFKGDDRPLGGRGLSGAFVRFFLRVLFRQDIDKLGLNHGASWFVLKKQD